MRSSQGVPNVGGFRHPQSREHAERGIRFSSFIALAEKKAMYSTLASSSSLSLLGAEKAKYRQQITIPESEPSTTSSQHA